MFPFSQEMSSDEAALIPLASGRGRGLSGESSIPREAWQRVVLQKGSPWGGGHQTSTSPSFSQNPGFVLSHATHSAGSHFPVFPRSVLGAPTTLPLAGSGSEGLDC